MPLTREQTNYVPTNDTVFLPTVAIDRNLGVRGNSVFDGPVTINSTLNVSLQGRFGSAATVLTAPRVLNLVDSNAVMNVRRHSDTGAPAIELRSYRDDGTTFTSWWDMFVTPALDGNGAGKFAIRDRTNSDVVRLILDSSGNVGIGSVSPTTRLHVVGPAAGNSAYFTDAVNSSLVIANLSGGVTLGTDGGGGIHLASGGAASGNRRLSIDGNGIISASGNFVQNVNATAKSAAYTLLTTDANTIVQMNGAFAFNIDATLATLPLGTTITLVALTAGVTIAATGSILPTLQSTPGLKLRAAYSVATAIKMTATAASGAASTWLISGDLTA